MGIQCPRGIAGLKGDESVTDNSGRKGRKIGGKVVSLHRLVRQTKFDGISDLYSVEYNSMYNFC